MSIKPSLSSDGLEEVFTAPTLKEICLYKCLTNKDILTKEVEVDQEMAGREKLDWEKFRLKEPIQKDLVEALLEAADKHMFQLTSKYLPILAAIRMSQPEHLVKVDVSGTETLTDDQLKWLISGGNVKSLDIHGCRNLRSGSLDSINKFGNKLECLRIGDSSQILPMEFFPSSGILRTPNLKTFIVYEICGCNEDYWRFLLHDFINNLEELEMNKCGWFESLEFLEPAKDRLSSLTLVDCFFNWDVKALAFPLKLNNLRSLNLFGSWIGEKVGENVVQRLLTAMPNLKSLAVDPGLVKDISMETSSRDQRSVGKRLEFLGIVDNDVATLRKAKLLADDVAHFGTVEGELRVLEYFSTQPTVTHDYFQRTLERLLKSLSEVAGTPPCNTVAVINLFLKTFKISGTSFNFVATRILKKMLTPDVAAKLGNALPDQCIEAICCFMKIWLLDNRDYLGAGREFISHVIDIIMNLDAKLCFDDYVTVVPLVMGFAKKTIWYSHLDDDIDMKHTLYQKIEQLLAKIVDRFPGENDELWGISSFLVLINHFMGEIVFSDEDRIRRHNLVKILSSMISSLRKLCLNSVPRRAEFLAVNGVGIVMELLKEIFNGRLGLTDRDSMALLEILQSILQDTNLELSESGRIASELEKILLSVHSKWELWKSSSSSSNAVGENTNYFKMQTISSLLNYLESDPRFDYKTNGAVKEIMMKLK